MIDATICVVDNGLFTELAVRLSRDFKTVLYSTQWEAEFPLLNDRVLGKGLEEIERVQDPYLRSVRERVDIYLFPDIFHAGKQEMLKDLGKLVWGSFQGDELETDRVMFRELQKELGLPTAEYEVINGISELRDRLKESGRCFVKASSKIRGSMETWEHKDYAQSTFILDKLAVKLGGFQDHVVFIVEQPIDVKFETGIDTYSVGGKFPNTPLQGIEIKGKLILVSAQTESTTPKPLDDAMSALAPVLGDKQYCNFFSAEFRKNILTDPCCRCPNPGIGVEMEMITNLGPIISEGVRGTLVEPEYEHEFGIQAAVFHDHEEEEWKQFTIPEELRRWFKLMEFCRVGQYYQIVPRRPFGQKIGWLIGVGNSIQEAADHLQDNAKMLKDYPVDIKLDALEEAVKEAHEAEKTGFEFSDKPIPKPETVLDNA